MHIHICIKSSESEQTLWHYARLYFGFKIQRESRILIWKTNQVFFGRNRTTCMQICMMLMVKYTYEISKINSIIISRISKELPLALAVPALLLLLQQRRVKLNLDYMQSHGYLPYFELLYFSSQAFSVLCCSRLRNHH